MRFAANVDILLVGGIFWQNAAPTQNLGVLGAILFLSSQINVGKALVKNSSNSA
jgi:hypothetical protein